jgi:hypothetical protein
MPVRAKLGNTLRYTQLTGCTMPVISPWLKPLNTLFMGSTLSGTWGNWTSSLTKYSFPGPLYWDQSGFW